MNITLIDDDGNEITEEISAHLAERHKFRVRWYGITPVSWGDPAYPKVQQLMKHEEVHDLDILPEDCQHVHPVVES